MKNERGGALVIVLLVVLVFTILGMGLLTMNISAAKQFNKKEEQVQARHLAEMGIIHYKAKVYERVKDYSGNVFKVVMKDGVVDKAESLKRYYEGLCTVAESVDVTPELTSIGTYTLVGNGVDWDCNISLSPTEMVLAVTSTGMVKGTSKVIEAKLTITSGEGGVGDGSGENEVSGSVPQKPRYPEDNWGSKHELLNLDRITNSNPAKVSKGENTKDNFVTSAFVEILGVVEMKNNANWTFKDHLLISESVSMKTGSKNAPLILNVNKDLHIASAFNPNNHNKVNIGGNFIVIGGVDIGNNTEVNVGGNALFDGKVSNVGPHSVVTIQQNAYFKNSLGTVNNNATFCVKGEIYLWKLDDWAPYLPKDAGYNGFTASCLGTSSGEAYDWDIKKEVNAEYK